MLRHFGYIEGANRIDNAVDAVLREGQLLTPDLGGTAKTREDTEAITKSDSDTTDCLFGSRIL
ncbi:hypothetical protein DFH05DRAFT_1499665 [Lentinula detonsa]|uniref:Uncharacterized protein n=1 Tax=Lentinula detonsa TaxID=2804962 RepID=A0A9W8TWC3_9AGAR|nr:hypothetical protein DFH05DRAFT_1499665 [Lentinula detonsa]